MGYEFAESIIYNLAMLVHAGRNIWPVFRSFMPHLFLAMIFPFPLKDSSAVTSCLAHLVMLQSPGRLFVEIELIG